MHSAARIPDGRVAHRSDFARRRRRRYAFGRDSEYFTPLGITAAADLIQVVMAVDFFVRAGVEGDDAKKTVPRDFRRIETWTKFGGKDGPPALSNFVYAVPKGAPETEADRQLREAAARIYGRYADRRPQYIKADQTGAVALWRAWLGEAAAVRQYRFRSFAMTTRPL